MSSRTTSRIAWLLLLGTLGGCVASVPGLVETWNVENEGAWGLKGTNLVAAVVFALAGALLAIKKPENAVGWLFGCVGAAFAVNALAEIYAITDLIRGSDSDLVYLTAWLTSWWWIVFLGLISFAILLFPTGHLPSPRWRARAWLIATGFALGCAGFAVAPGPLNNIPPRFTNRYALPESPITETFIYIGMFTFMAALLSAAAGVVQRYRSSIGLQRQQMKMFVSAAVALVTSMLLVIASELVVPAIGNVAEVVSTLALLSIPVAMAVAILRYRLYDIDLIINRTLVYGALTAILLLAYLGLVVLLQRVLAPLTTESDLAVAASTLAVAALFRPLRSRVQAFIDRRFYRRRYDAGETVAAFSASLREEVDLHSLSKELVRVVGMTMQPAHAQLWLRDAGGEE